MSLHHTIRTIFHFRSLGTYMLRAIAVVTLCGIAIFLLRQELDKRASRVHAARANAAAASFASGAVAELQGTLRGNENILAVVEALVPPVASGTQVQSELVAVATGPLGDDPKLTIGEVREVSEARSERNIVRSVAFILRGTAADTGVEDVLGRLARFPYILHIVGVDVNNPPGEAVGTVTISGEFFVREEKE